MTSFARLTVWVLLWPGTYLQCLGGSYQEATLEPRLVRSEELGISHVRHEAEVPGRGSVTWEDASEEIKKLQLVNDTLFAFGWCGRASESVSIIDVKRSILADYILGRSFALSPSGRYLAFKQFRPRHELQPPPGYPPPGDVLVLYDVPQRFRSRTAFGLGPQGFFANGVFDSGNSLYPGEVGRSRVNVRTNYEEVLVFSIKWERDDRLAALALDSFGLLVVSYDARTKARTMARVPGASRADIDPSGKATIREMDRLLEVTELDAVQPGTAAVRFKLRGEPRDVRVRR